MKFIKPKHILGIGQVMSNKSEDDLLKPTTTGQLLESIRRCEAALSSFDQAVNEAAVQFDEGLHSPKGAGSGWRSAEQTVAQSATQTRACLLNESEELNEIKIGDRERELLELKDTYVAYLHTWSRYLNGVASSPESVWSQGPRQGIENASDTVNLSLGAARGHFAPKDQAELERLFPTLTWQSAPNPAPQPKQTSETTPRTKKAPTRQRSPKRRGGFSQNPPKQRSSSPLRTVRQVSLARNFVLLVAVIVLAFGAIFVVGVLANGPDQLPLIQAGSEFRVSDPQPDWNLRFVYAVAGLAATAFVCVVPIGLWGLLVSQERILELEENRSRRQ